MRSRRWGGRGGGRIARDEDRGGAAGRCQWEWGDGRRGWRIGYLGVAVMVAVSVLVLTEVLAFPLLGSMGVYMQRNEKRNKDLLDDRLC